jgi:sugar O-acyltransferase (sialic acid O-acetyltransferase NeuD family)
MNFVFGTGGFAREVDWLLHDVYLSGQEDFRPTMFVTEDNGVLDGSTIKGRPVISESRFLSDFARSGANCFIAIGSPEVRSRIVDRLDTIPDLRFPAVVHPTVSMDRRHGAIAIGPGSILCGGSILTTDISIGRFVHVNLNCTIGHDASVADFCTLAPGAHISGQVRLENSVYVGTGAVLIERLDVCACAVIGAGAVVRESIKQVGTYVGVPARRLRRGS